MTTTIRIERVVTQKLDVTYDCAKNQLVLTRKGKKVLTFTNEMIDSGALFGHLDPGHVVVPLESETLPDITRRLERAGVIKLIGKPWSTWGGDRYQAARVLID